jgi:hypothetical protein
MEEYEKLVRHRPTMVRAYRQDDGSLNLEFWKKVGGSGKRAHRREIPRTQIHIWKDIADAFSEEINP